MSLARIGVLAIMKNEAMNVTEWLDHYQWLGIDEIFLIDNGSTDETIQRVNSHRMRDRVELVLRPEPHQQVRHYRDVYRELNIRDRVDWLMMADLDEFWFVKDGSCFRRLLEAQHKGSDLIYTNWTVFGSGGYDRHPESLRLELTSARPKLSSHANTKYIARTSALTDGERMGTHKVRDMDIRRIVSDNIVLQLNHYVTQSREFWESVKMTRGDASNARNDATRTWEYFQRYDAACTAEDTRLAALLQQQGQWCRGKR